MKSENYDENGKELVHFVGNLRKYNAKRKVSSCVCVWKKTLQEINLIFFNLVVLVLQFKGAVHGVIMANQMKNILKLKNEKTANNVEGEAAADTAADAAAAAA